MDIATLMKDLPEFQKDLLKYLKRHSSGTTQAVLAQNLNVSESKVSRHMSALITQGLVVKQGSTKIALVMLHPDVNYWSTPPHLRPRVDFDPLFLDTYIPNSTHYLSEVMSQKLQTITPLQKLDASTYGQGVLERFLIDLSFASSGMEGNTYNQLETEALIKYGEEALGKTHYEALMILNHKRAISFVLENLDAPLDLSFANRVHTLLMRGLLEPKDLGVTRKNEVSIGGSSYRPSSSMTELRSGLSSTLYKADQIDDPFEAMIFLMANTSYVQHFEDGNKRMGRILANIPLLRKGLPPLSFVGVNKTNYIQGLLEYYEQRNTSTLSNTLIEGYLQAAHIYSASRETSQFPKSSELRFRKTIDEIMNFIIIDNMREDDIKPYIKKQLKSLPNDNKEDVYIIVSEYLNNLTVEQGVLWDVNDKQVEDFLINRPQRIESKLKI